MESGRMFDGLQLDEDEGILLQAEDLEGFGKRDVMIDEMILTNKNLFFLYERHENLFKANKIVDKISLSSIKVVNGNTQVMKIKYYDQGEVLQLLYRNGDRDIIAFHETERDMAVAEWVNTIHTAITGDETPLIVVNDSKQEQKKGLFGFIKRDGKNGKQSSKPHSSMAEKKNENNSPKEPDVEDRIFFCTICGKEILDGYEFCPECGTKISNDLGASDETESFFDTYNGKTKICKKCGAEMPVDSFYCLNCGNKFQESWKGFDTTRKKSDMQTGLWRNKWISLVLCVLFGWLGIHRFYEEKVITGLLYLFTLGLFGIGWIADIMRIALKPNPYRVK